MSPNAAKKMTPLEEQMTFYGEYHSNTINVAIHMIFVPTILWSAFVWGTQTGPLLEAPAWVPMPVNLSFIVAAFFSAYYVYLEAVAGLMATPVVFLLCYLANLFATSTPNAIFISIGIHVVAWIMQFIGHGVFEKRAPALLDNLFGALVNAPFFVFLEVLFAIGYRPDLHKKLTNSIGVAITEYRKTHPKNK